MGKKKREKAGAEGGLAARPVGGMAIARDWPVYEALLSTGWEKPGALTTILFARRSPTSGKIAAASFLVDLGCLGVKSAQVKLHKDVNEYNAGLRAHMLGVRPMERADPNLAAKIIFTGVNYAANLGFKPDPIFAQAELLLLATSPETCSVEVPTGSEEGKPFFVNGPYDNVEKVMAQLMRAVGVGNFHYVIQGDATAMDLPDEVRAQLVQEPERPRLEG
ncbi:hypothetical protein EYB53_006630 [Candidatus Chloroploca sp. M-50]|uniref:Uncharacterized protein n=1 Tax=Candidatus Chloroploca mongolica TaxID=2528176 RepID=A0ABS4D7F3_9CHLR|nr:hypothetical protein [Candidatus Chloroploca mongolica]MBP1465376.1 hypothetical protein [Candidatus Chloroploca mongolica]